MSVPDECKMRALIEKILQTANIQTVTAKMIRKQLEADLGIPLKKHRHKIRDVSFDIIKKKIRATTVSEKPKSLSPPYSKIEPKDFEQMHCKKPGRGRGKDIKMSTNSACELPHPTGVAKTVTGESVGLNMSDGSIKRLNRVFHAHV